MKIDELIQLSDCDTKGGLEIMATVHVRTVEVVDPENYYHCDDEGEHVKMVTEYTRKRLKQELVGGYCCVFARNSFGFG